MRRNWHLPALAAALLAAPASAQTIAYTNFLRFDLQSFRSQATAGLFDDDIEKISDAAKLMDVEGNRLFTNFANLSDPATLGDNILTYSVDHVGQPSSDDPFDSGSYLLGWIGKYDRDSEYNFSIFYQRNSSRSMFEDLEDGIVGGGSADGFDAEFTGWTSTLTHAADNTVVAEQRRNFDLQRYDERSATDFDFGAARDISEKLSIGGRFFYENDRLDSFSDGRVETINRADTDADPGTPLATVGRLVSEWVGNGADAFGLREVGVSLDGNYHPWNHQSFGLRLDVFGTTVTNPGISGGAADLTLRSLLGEEAVGPFYEGWEQINLSTQTTYTTVAQGTTVLGGGALDQDRESRTWITAPYGYGGYAGDLRGSAFALEDIDDERSGIGFALKGEWNREFKGGDQQTWLGLAHRGVDIELESVSTARAASTFWWNDGSGAGDFEAITTTADDTIELSRTGDQSVNVLEAGTRWTRDLNSHVSVGLGGILTRETWKEEYDQTSVTTAVSSRFDDGSGTFGDNLLYAATGSDPAYNEVSVTSITTDAQDITDETRTTWIRLPVGGQFHFKDRWTFNLGAQHTMVRVDRDTSVRQGPDGGGQRVDTLVDTAAGTTSVNYGTVESAQDLTVKDKATANTTTYWYGISVMITDAAQLDVNGFFDTHSGDDSVGGGSPDFDSGTSLSDVDFFRNLAISLKYIFW